MRISKKQYIDGKFAPSFLLDFEYFFCQKMVIMC